MVIWNIRTGEKLQVIAFPYSGQVSAVLWIPEKGERWERLALAVLMDPFIYGSLLKFGESLTINSILSLIKHIPEVHFLSPQPSIGASGFHDRHEGQ